MGASLVFLLSEIYPIHWNFDFLLCCLVGGVNHLKMPLSSTVMLPLPVNNEFAFWMFQAGDFGPSNFYSIT